MNLASIDRWVANNLPTDTLKDFYPRAMRRLAEMGLPAGHFVATTKHGFKMEVNRLDAIKWYVHYFGEFEPQISRAWKRLLRPGGTVIDIGGNIGYHALLAGACVGETGRVLTFEPAAKNYNDLVTNITSNAARQITAFHMAIADKPGEVEIRYAGDNEQGSSSIVRGSGPATKVKAIDFVGIKEHVPLEVIDLIKIDVEGAEPLVIEGMLPAFRCLKDDCVIFIEVGEEHAGQGLLSPFFEAGFEARTVANEYRTSFYRDRDNRVTLSHFEDTPGKLQDVALSRNPAVFDVMMG